MQYHAPLARCTCLTLLRAGAAGERVRAYGAPSSVGYLGEVQPSVLETAGAPPSTGKHDALAGSHVSDAHDIAAADEGPPGMAAVLHLRIELSCFFN
jgi:hypothetical protein